jgi:hypothetical protein
MKLKLYNLNNRYAFCVDGFSSKHHASLSYGCKDTFNYAWEAYRFAQTLALKQKYHIEAIRNKRYAIEDLTTPVTIDINAEEMLEDHYRTIFNMIEQKSNGLEKDKDKREIVYNEIKSIVDEILKVNEKLESGKVKGQINSIMSKFRHLVHEKFHDLLQKDVKEQKENPPEPTPAPVADQDSSQNPLPETPDLSGSMQEASDKAIGANTFFKMLKMGSCSKKSKEEILDGYAVKVCKAIENKHPYAICKVDLENNHINIVDANNGDLILRVAVNKNEMNIDDIIPFGTVSSIFPANSFEFYQRYWKPIVESVGHFFVKEAATTLTTDKISFPDIPNKRSASYNLRGLKPNSSVQLWFVYKNESLWGFTKSSEKIIQAQSQDSKKIYTEDDFIIGSPKEVMCIDPSLKSIYGKTGEVVGVIPLKTHIEVDVDFGRATMRLTGDQIRIINIDDLQTST